MFVGFAQLIDCTSKRHVDFRYPLIKDPDHNVWNMLKGVLVQSPPSDDFVQRQKLWRWVMDDSPDGVGKSTSRDRVTYLLTARP